MLTARYISILLGICTLVAGCSRSHYIVLENVTPKPMKVLAKALDPNVPTVFVCSHPNVLDPSPLIDTVINNEHWLRCYLESGDEIMIGRVDSLDTEYLTAAGGFFDSTLKIEYVDTNSMFYSQLIIEYDSTGYAERMKNKEGGVMIPTDHLTPPSGIVMFSDSAMLAQGYAIHPPGRSVFPTRNSMRLVIWPTQNLLGRTSGWKMHYIPDMYALWQ